MRWNNSLNNQSFAYDTKDKFVKLKLIGGAQASWEGLKHHRFMNYKTVITDWEDTKEKV